MIVALAPSFQWKNLMKESVWNASILESWNIDTFTCILLSYRKSWIIRREGNVWVFFVNGARFFWECRSIILETGRTIVNQNFIPIPLFLWISSCFRFLRMRTVEMKFISQRSTSGIVCSYSPSNSWPARDRGGGRCIPHSPNSSAQWAVSWIRNDTPLLPARKKNRDFRSALERSLAAVRLRRREREINKRGGKKTVEEIHPSEDRQDSLR